MRKKFKQREENIRKLRKKGYTLIKGANYDEAIELFQETLELAPCDDSTLKCLFNTYFEMKEFQKAEFYAKMLLDRNKKDFDANNIKFNALLKQNKIEEAKKFLDENEVLKSQENYYELKTLIQKELEKQAIKKVQIINPKKIITNIIKVDYIKLLELEKENFSIDSKYAPEYQNPKLTLLEKQEHGTKIIANEDIKKGELLCISKAYLVHFDNENIPELEFFKNAYDKFTTVEKEYFLSLSRKDNLKLSLRERIDRCNKYIDIGMIIDFFKHNSLPLEGCFFSSLKPYPYLSQACFGFPSYFNHSCDPNTFQLTIGDVFILIAMKDIKEKEEIFISYFQGNLRYQERQKITREKYRFECNCDYCKYELEFVKKSQMKKVCENLKNILKNYYGYFPFSKDYGKVKNFIKNNHKYLYHIDLWNIAEDFEELSMNDMSTLEDRSIIFEMVFDIMNQNNNFLAKLKCAQNLIRIYYNLNNYEKCKESFDKLEKSMSDIFLNNNEFVEDFVCNKMKKEEKLEKLKEGIIF